MHRSIAIAELILIGIWRRKTRIWPDKLAISQIKSLAVYTVIVVPNLGIRGPQNLSTEKVMDHNSSDIALTICWVLF